jgi:hypothetical protein
LPRFGVAKIDKARAVFRRGPSLKALKSANLIYAAMFDRRKF